MLKSDCWRKLLFFANYMAGVGTGVGGVGVGGAGAGVGGKGRLGVEPGQVKLPVNSPASLYCSSAKLSIESPLVSQHYIIIFA